jgi:dTDP-4-amino-4,6-dideoxygalactose transaminase
LKKIKVTKNEIIEKFLDKGIKLQVHYIPLHFQPFYKKNAIYKKSDLKNSENFYNQEISLPVYPDLKTKDIRYVIKNLLYIK